MPETRSVAKEYLKVYTEQFLFWKKCNLDEYPWLNQAVYKIDEIYMDVHKIVDNEDVFWLLDGLDRRSQNHEIIDAVNKMLVKQLSHSVTETKRIFDEAVKKTNLFKNTKRIERTTIVLSILSKLLERMVLRFLTLLQNSRNLMWIHHVKLAASLRLVVMFVHHFLFR